MAHSDLGLDEISRRVVEAVVESNYVNPTQLLPRIRSILRIWLTRRDSVKRTKPRPKNRYTKSVKTLEKEKFECVYWKRELRSIIGEEEMKKHYQVLEEKLDESGLIIN